MIRCLPAPPLLAALIQLPYAGAPHVGDTTLSDAATLMLRFAFAAAATPFLYYFFLAPMLPPACRARQLIAAAATRLRR